MFWKNRIDRLESKLDELLLDKRIKDNIELRDKYIGKEYTYVKNSELVCFRVSDVFFNSRGRIVISGGEDLGMIGMEHAVDIFNAMPND